MIQTVILVSVIAFDFRFCFFFFVEYHIQFCHFVKQTGKPYFNIMFRYLSDILEIVWKKNSVTDRKSVI